MPNGVTTLGTLAAAPEKPPRCHPRTRPRLAASSLIVQLGGVLRPPGPPVGGAGPAGACAATGAAASTAHAPAAAHRLLLLDTVTLHARTPSTAVGAGQSAAWSAGSPVPAPASSCSSS